MPKQLTVVWVSMLLALSGASTAAAQEQGQVGVTLTYPTSVGILWHATDRIGLKTTFGFTHSSDDTTYMPVLPLGSLIPGGILPDDYGYATTTSSTTMAWTLSGLFYLSNADGVSTYLSPRVTINHSSYHAEVSGIPIINGGTLRDDSSTHAAFAGLFGVQYAPNRRFSVFAEVGLESASSGSSTTDNIESEVSTVGTRSAVGVVFYFGK